MSDITYDCPYCRALLKDGTETCTVCGSKMNIAVLVCSHPIGDVQAGAKWNLYPRSYSLDFPILKSTCLQQQTLDTSRSLDYVPYCMKIQTALMVT